MKIDDIVGKVIESIKLSDDKEQLTLSFKDGSCRVFQTEGDCCSSTWIEHLELPKDVIGATILPITDHDYEDKFELEPHPDEDENGELKVYQTHIPTDRGHIAIEYRNSSNGYYGGWLE